MRCAVRKADCIAETIGLAWKWFLRLMERGKDITRFVGTLASLAARAVGAGRRACGQERANDVMSPVAQRRHGFKVESLPTSRRSYETLNDVHGQRMLDTMEERLRDNTVTPPADQAAFRIDFPAWLKTLTARERRMIRLMALNRRTKELSRQFEVSSDRISQMRRVHDGWRRFVGDEEDETQKR